MAESVGLAAEGEADHEPQNALVPHDTARAKKPAGTATR
jgi:hypothetical protein